MAIREYTSALKISLFQDSLSRRKRVGIKQVQDLRRDRTSIIPKIQQRRRLKKKSDFHANCSHSKSDFLDAGAEEKDEEHCCDSDSEEERWINLNSLP